MRSYSSLLVLLFVGMSLLSCKHSATDRIDEELTAFMGKKIEFPLDSMLYMGDAVGTFHREKYMYVVYTDSSSCSYCAINHFSDWADIELQEYCEKGLLSYVFIVNPSRVMKESPDWDYFSALRPAECTIIKKNLAGAFYYKGVFVPAGASYTVYGTRMECQFHLINRCDVTKQTSCRES